MTFDLYLLCRFASGELSPQSWGPLQPPSPQALWPEGTRYPIRQCPYLLQDVFGNLRSYHLPEKFLVASIVVRMAPCNR